MSSEPTKERCRLSVTCNTSNCNSNKCSQQSNNCSTSSSRPTVIVTISGSNKTTQETSQNSTIQQCAVISRHNRRGAMRKQRVHQVSNYFPSIDFLVPVEKYMSWKFEFPVEMPSKQSFANGSINCRLWSANTYLNLAPNYFRQMTIIALSRGLLRTLWNWRYHWSVTYICIGRGQHGQNDRRSEDFIILLLLLIGCGVKGP